MACSTWNGLLGRVAMETAGPREVVALGDYRLRRLPGVAGGGEGVQRRRGGSEIVAAFDTLEDLL